MTQGTTAKKFKKDALTLTILAALPMSSLAAVSPQEAQNAESKGELELTKAETDKDETFKVDETGSVKLTQPVADTPRSINVISSGMLEQQGVTSLNDALRNVAGVSTFGGGEGGGGVISASDKVTIRGFDARSSIYVDGIRDIAGYSRDMFNYEQVDVIKGASSTIDGRSNGGGSLNLNTKRARLGDFSNVTARYDTFETARVTADVNKELSDNTAGRINLLYSDGGDTFDNGEENYETTGIAASLLHNFSDKTNANLDVFIMEQDNTPVLGLPFITESAAAATGRAEGPLDADLWDGYYGIKGRDYEDVSTRMYTLTVNHELNNDFTLRSQTRYGTNEKESVLGRPWWGRDDQASLLIGSRTQGLDNENELFVTQLDVIGELDAAGMIHNLVVGAEYAKEEQTNFGVSSDFIYYDGSGTIVEEAYIDPFAGANNFTATGGLVRNGSDTKGESDTLAIYAFDTIKLNEQFTLDVNARFDDFDIEGSACGRRSGCATGLDAEDTFLSYGAALSYSPTKNGNIYVSYGNSEQPPGTNLALSTNDEQNSLDPQSSKSFELGTKWELFEDQLMVTAAVFKTTKDVVDSERLTDAEGNSVTNYYLTGEQEAKGFEIGVVGKLTDSLSVSANYSKLDTEITQDLNADTVGNGLQGSPDDTASVWLSWMGMNNKLNIGGGLYYNSGETFWRRNMAYFTVDAYTTAYMMASYQVTEDLKVQLNIDNLFDEEYVTDYSAKGHFRPGNPRSAALFVSYQF